jgi:hypothetical protein
MVVVARATPRSRVRRGRAGAARPATWRSSRSTGGARAAGPGPPCSAGRGSPSCSHTTHALPPRTSSGAGWWCSRRSRRRPRGWPRDVARPPPAGCRPRPRRSWCRACSSGSRSGCRPRSWSLAGPGPPPRSTPWGLDQALDLQPPVGQVDPGGRPGGQHREPRLGVLARGQPGRLPGLVRRRRRLNPRDTNPPTMHLLGSTLACSAGLVQPSGAIIGVAVADLDPLVGSRSSCLARPPGPARRGGPAAAGPASGAAAGSRRRPEAGAAAVP